jgi:NADH-ubiquinone oxidoreductase chain 1
LGPNKPAFAGLLQPIADAVKLFLKTHFSPGRTHKLIFFIGPRLSLSLVLWVWLTTPFFFDTRFFLFSAIIIIIIMRINVYPLLLIGWASNNKYSILGGLRRVAQTISYEIRFALIILSILVLIRATRLDLLAKTKTFYRIFIVSPVIFLFWVVSRVAETNRTPFDFSEGERELVSGFNTEYGAGGFAIIFIAEYGRIYFLSIITGHIFSPQSRIFALGLFVRIILFI